MTTSSVTLTLVELRDLLAPVLPHADGGGSLPVLGCVQFRVEGEWLIATATDRYTVAACRHKVPAGTTFECLVQSAELKTLLAMFRANRGNAGHSVTLTIDEGASMLRAEGASAMFAEAVVSYNLYKGEYPRISTIFDKVGEPGPFEPTAFNPQMLTKFAHATRGRGEPLVLSGYSPTKPMYVRAGDHFLGAIMPMRATADIPDWRDVFAAPEPAKAVSA